MSSAFITSTVSLYRFFLLRMVKNKPNYVYFFLTIDTAKTTGQDFLDNRGYTLYGELPYGVNVFIDFIKQK